MSERTNKWPITPICILGYSGPLCISGQPIDHYKSFSDHELSTIDRCFFSAQKRGKVSCWGGKLSGAEEPRNSAPSCNEEKTPPRKHIISCSKKNFPVYSYVGSDKNPYAIDFAAMLCMSFCQ